MNFARIRQSWNLTLPTPAQKVTKRVPKLAFWGTKVCKRELYLKPRDERKKRATPDFKYIRHLVIKLEFWDPSGRHLAAFSPKCLHATCNKHGEIPVAKKGEYRWGTNGNPVGEKKRNPLGEQKLHPIAPEPHPPTRISRLPHPSYPLHPS